MGNTDTLACELCGSPLPSGVSGPHCDRCMLGIPGDEKPKAAPPVTAARRERRRRPRHVRPARVGSWGVLAAILMFYAILHSSASGDDFLTLMRWVKDNDQIWRGELWRFVTPVFAHFNVWHMVGNFCILLLFGPQLEVLVGTPRFLAIFLLAGVSGVLGSFCFVDELSAGASGGIFGIFGGIFAFLVTNRTSLHHLRTRDVAFYALCIALLLMLTSLMPQVDNFAHVGGLLGGFFSGLMLVPRLPGLVPKPRLRWLGATLFVLMWVAGIYRGSQWMGAMTQGRYAYAQGDIPGARAAFARAATLRRRPIPALIALARIEAREGRLAAAEKAVLALRDEVPDNVDVHSYLAELYREQGRWKDSLIELEAIHTYRPEKTRILPQLGRAYLENGDAKKAVEILSAVQPQAYDDDPLAEYSLGDALRRTGQIERGEKYLRAYEDRLRKLTETQQSAKSLNNLAWFLFEEGRSLDEALQMATKAVAKDPVNQYYLGTLGCVYYQLGRYKEAQAQLEKALERHVSKADAATDLYFAAMTAVKQGQPDIAKKFLKMAEEADPRNRYLALAKRTVEAK